MAEHSAVKVGGGNFSILLNINWFVVYHTNFLLNEGFIHVCEAHLNSSRKIHCWCFFSLASHLRSLFNKCAFAQHFYRKAKHRSFQIAYLMELSNNFRAELNDNLLKAIFRNFEWLRDAAIILRSFDCDRHISLWEILNFKYFLLLWSDWALAEFEENGAKLKFWNKWLTFYN